MRRAAHQALERIVTGADNEYKALADKYDRLVSRYNNVVDLYNLLVVASAYQPRTQPLNCTTHTYGGLDSTAYTHCY